MLTAAVPSAQQPTARTQSTEASNPKATTFGDDSIDHVVPFHASMMGLGAKPFPIPGSGLPAAPDAQHCVALRQATEERMPPPSGMAGVGATDPDVLFPRC